MMYKTILRYPGGKSRAVEFLYSKCPENFTEYREPFAGGASLFLYVKQRRSTICKYWINDINEDLYLFWEYAKNRNADLVKTIESFRKKFENGRDMYYYMIGNKDQFSPIELAARFFILNRITFSGTADAGGYSQQAFEKRFTESSINRLILSEQTLKDTQVTNFDYADLLYGDGRDVFIFLDPPYYSAMKSRLYGKRGCDHVGFDFVRLADHLKHCKHKYLLTLDDDPYIRDTFSFAFINEWSLQYGMNNVSSNIAKKGNELLITNYPLPSHQLDLFERMIV